MIIRIFKSGVSNGESPVKYLLGNIDHSGNERSVTPEILEGLAQTTIDVINSIQRKYKYISGCISFRDSEKPTKAQLHELIDDFKKTFCPALTGDNFNSLFVLHQDKQNTEVHFVIPNQELRSSRRFNIHPPGKSNIQFFESFVKLTNHKLGYAQVIPDPLKIAFTDFERKSPEGRKNKSNKRWIQSSIIKAITNGEIKNRDDLCKHLDEQFGISVTRRGKDYLSVKMPGAPKAYRLRGTLYGEDANYQLLIKQSAASKQPQYLSPSEFKVEQTKLASFVYEREQFNIKAYLTPRPIRRLAKKIRPQQTIITRSPAMAKTDYLPIMKKIIQDALISVRKKPTNTQPIKPLPSKNEALGNITAIRKKSLAVSSPHSINLDSLKLTIAEVEKSMHEAISNMNQAKTPEEVARHKQRVIELKIQLERLHAQMMALKIQNGLSNNRLKR